MKTFIFLLFLFLLPSAYALDYYADIQIDIANDGGVSVNGLTNHPNLSFENSQEFTSKHKKYWLVNITLEDEFSDYVFDLKLPNGAVVNYLKVSDIISIKEKNNRITITGSGTNEPFSVIAQYSIQPEIVSKNYWWIWFIALGLVVLGSYFLVSSSLFSHTKKINYKVLTERQKLIMKAIEKAGGHLTQNALQDQVTMPKSSLSRNIDALVRKNLITKEQKGMTNVLSLTAEKNE